MTVAKDTHTVNLIMRRCTIVSSTHQIHLPPSGNGRFEDMVQVHLGASAKGIANVAPIDHQDLQDLASALRAITPIVGVV